MRGVLIVSGNECTGREEHKFKISKLASGVFIQVCYPPERSAKSFTNRSYL